MPPAKPAMPGRSAPSAKAPTPARVKAPPAKGSKIGDNSNASEAALDAMFEDSTTDVQGQDLQRISVLINEAAELESEAEAMVEQAKKISVRMEEIKKKELPDLLQQAGVREFKDIATGTKVTLEMWVSAKWPKTPEGVKKALAWLKKVGAEDLVKCNIEATYIKGHAKAARDAVVVLKKSGAATVSLEEAVHSSTLPAFLKERIEAGLTVELDLFEGASGTRAKIKPGKEKKK